MTTNFYVYLFLGFVFAILLAGFQYLYKNKSTKKVKVVLFFLRFSSVFLLILLLINPKIKKTIITIVKPSLILLADNSKSITNLKQEKNVLKLVNEISSNQKIRNKFNVESYTFSNDISFTDTLDFNGNTTNIYQSLRSIDKIYKKSIAPIIILTDGNQTKGNNYRNINTKQNIYPIVIGDTTNYKDIYISQLNVNKYAYLKNKFPVELFINYKGIDPIKSKLTVKNGNATVFSKLIQLNSKKKGVKIDFFLNANTVGFHNYKVQLSSLENEKNRLNNKKSFTVEVLDEHSKIALISDVLHPDIAMFKRSIESNKQRKVNIIRPSSSVNVDDYQLFILYQPNQKFKTVFKTLKEKNKNFFIITGTQTEWDFLNNNQDFFKKKALSSKEDYLPIYNSNYQTFTTENIGFENFQPLSDYFGKISFSVPYQSMLFQQVGGLNSALPLMATFTHNNRRGAVLFGENSWRWRMTSKIENSTFQPFDTFINNIIQYLASNKKDNYLDVICKPYYYQNESIKITAKSYDANYVFNKNAKLWITIINKLSKKQLKYPFALTNNNFEVNVSDLKKGTYTYSVKNELTKSNVYGSFIVLDYNVEQQFSNANKVELEHLAKTTNGAVFYPGNTNELLKSLTSSTKYKSIQKSKVITKPLIDWQWLLGLISFLLASEWFIRKYKGYI